MKGCLCLFIKRNMKDHHFAVRPDPHGRPPYACPGGDGGGHGSFFSDPPGIFPEQPDDQIGWKHLAVVGMAGKKEIHSRFLRFGKPSWLMVHQEDRQLMIQGR